MEKQLEKILINNTNFIDLRSEKEFQKGTIPNSINLPILSNEEYKCIGIEYKKNGQKAAIELGYRLVSGEIKFKRIQKWCKYIKNNPNTKIYCHRGGLRSQIALKWITDNGFETSAINGGYKTLRNFCLDIIKLKKKRNNKWIIIGGYTGSGKTDFISSYSSAIDLERIANHRGSAFGKRSLEQPTLSNFENQLAILYIRNISDYIILEDESRLIGKNILHNNWYTKMQNSDLIILKTNFEDRVKNIYNEYILDPLLSNVNNEFLFNRMRKALFDIKKRLTEKKYTTIYNLMKNAFNNENKDMHKDWIKEILKHYYDPMYQYKMEKRKKNIIFEGLKIEIESYLKGLGIFKNS